MKARRRRDTGRLTPADWARPVTAVRHRLPRVPPKRDAFVAAMGPCDRYSLSHWDGMILGSCRAAAVRRVYNKDMGAPRMIDEIELSNPFAYGQE